MSGNFFLQNKNKIYTNLINSLFPENLLNKINSACHNRLSGLQGTYLSFFLYRFFQFKKQTVVIVLPDNQTAENVYYDLINISTLQDICFFPDLDLVPYEDISPPARLIYQRQAALFKLTANIPALIITTARAAVRKIVNKQIYHTHIINLQVKQIINRDKLFQQLELLGYNRVSRVAGYGEYAVRGGIIDIYSPSSAYPCRLEFFDNELEEIRLFHTESQISFTGTGAIHILPNRELCLNNDIVADKRDRIKSIYKDKKQLDDLLQKLNHSYSFPGIEQYLPLFYDNTAVLSSYFEPDNTICFFYHPEQLREKINSFHLEYQTAFNAPDKKEKVKVPVDKILINAETLFKTDFTSIYPLAGGRGKEFSFNPGPVKSYKKNIKKFAKDTAADIKNGYSVYLSAGFSMQVQRLAQLFAKLHPITVDEKNSYAINFKKSANSFYIIQSSLTSGFTDHKNKIILICDFEIFNRSRKRNENFSNENTILENYLDLKPDDYVVHINHGIGLYRGLQKIETQKLQKDYLTIEYSGGSKLYIPVEQINLIQKYIGVKKKQVKLNKLGGSGWSKIKNRVKNDIARTAAMLLDLYAARKKFKSRPFAPDSFWQYEFEADFNFTETPDQLKAVAEIKHDMEQPRAMDRLLCGDVGYGKTEIAMRALFKTVLNDRQAALLAPTTVLSEQHYHNFIERFSNYPVNIDVINRFCSFKSQRAIIKKIKEGKIDLLIGTHRLLADDIKFRNLGLLIIDEEQKFGVKQKEKIKQVSRMVDSLSLSATPIPRTLHMSLASIRDISLIKTPPRNRLPVKTFVMEFNENIIRQAVHRETARGGQVFFVHNRVASITAVTVYLQKLLPGIRINYAHGRLPEDQLEVVMKSFINQEYDMLVCTAIIESGLDIPNVNTIFINKAHQLGLAQLYQLRGRVGRANREAFAYMFYNKNRVLTEQAMQRLRSISDFTSLGSGFKIAMRDLEIRGAGNLLGPQQSGNITAVGYELYCKLLEEAVRKVKGRKTAYQNNAVIDIRYNGFIPDFYIPDNRAKIEIYRKISAVNNEEDFNKVYNELLDRYGKPPAVIKKLFKISRLRIKAGQLKISAIREKINSLELSFSPDSKINRKKIIRLTVNSSRYFVKPHRKNSFFIKIKNSAKKKHLNYSLDEKIAAVNQLLKQIS